MAHTITVKVGGIPGESVGVEPDPKSPLTGAKPHKGEIDALSWHWGITQTAKASKGGGTSTADVHDLTIVKNVDSSTPLLLSACLSATVLKGADKDPDATVGVVLTLFKNADGKNLEYMVIKLLGNVIVSSVSAGEAGADDLYTETVTFNFTKAQIGYKASLAAGVANTDYNVA